MNSRLASTVLCLALMACGSDSLYTDADIHTDSMSSSSALQAVALRSPDGREVTVRAEIADDAAEQTIGLMHRESLADGTGMLFIFPDEQPRSFWMKNTLIQLDILFFDADGAWVSTRTMQPCDGDPCELYGSGRPAKYALEVESGFAGREGVGEGWRLRVAQ